MFGIVNGTLEQCCLISFSICPTSSPCVTEAINNPRPKAQRDVLIMREFMILLQSEPINISISTLFPGRFTKTEQSDFRANPSTFSSNESFTNRLKLLSIETVAERTCRSSVHINFQIERAV